MSWGSWFGSIMPGHQAMAGTRTPPSRTSPFAPLRSEGVFANFELLELIQYILNMLIVQHHHGRLGVGLIDILVILMFFGAGDLQGVAGPVDKKWLVRFGLILNPFDHLLVALVLEGFLSAEAQLSSLARYRLAFLSLLGNVAGDA
jgi:hypothetical protein